MSVVLPLIKNVFKLSAKSVLVTSGLTAAVSATDAAITKFYGLNTTILVFLNEDVNDFIKNN